MLHNIACKKNLSNLYLYESRESFSGTKFLAFYMQGKQWDKAINEY